MVGMGPPDYSPILRGPISSVFLYFAFLFLMNLGLAQANLCASNPCENTGTCTLGGSGYTCACLSTKSGTHCESHTTCLSNPCQNSGACAADGATAGYTCSCTATKSGDHCESHTTCLSNPCQNSGTCAADGATAGYTCSCLSTKSGDHCESHTTCLSNPCQNSGTCAADGATAGYTCSCLSTKSGDHCESHTTCLSNPCQNSGTCAADGATAGYTCSCLSTKSGDHCESHTTCLSNPCQNSGTCAADGATAGYTCSCLSTKSGDHCESHTTCLSNPCQNSGTCAADGATAGYTCSCLSTKSGDHCESHTTCLSNPCQNSGTCAADGATAGYTCSCLSTKSGDHCESHTTCLSNPCQNSGTCAADGATAGYTCSCLSTKSGDHCESHTTCLSNPCQNSGTCAADGATAGYTCSCISTKSGDHCESHTTCLSNPCQNSGTCAADGATAGYTCSCISTKSGDHCESHTTCLSNPCQNSGTCAADGATAGYTCSCISTKSGDHCESHTTCLSNPCQNSGTCAADGATAGYTCSCLSTKSGDHCESHTTCLSNPCQNSGTCAADGATAGYTCSCISTKSGDHCESHTTCLSNPCQNSGTCAADGATAGYTCSCISTKSGDHCESHTTCLSNPCQNSGTCAADGATAGYTCSCLSTKSGDHCESHTTCLSNPCQNSGTCEADGATAGYTCSCISTKSGDHCESHTTCLSNPCQNGGTCAADGSTAGYTCSCVAGRTGTHCELYAVCVSEPCHNGATCAPLASNTEHYECTCTAIKSGTHCESHTTCLSNPCQNGGTCEPEAGGGAGYTCTCPADRTGTHCETYVICLSEPCQHGSTCSPTVANTAHYECACTTIKSGTHCEEHITCLSNPCQHGATCIPHTDDGAGYLCTCPAGKTGTHCENHIVCLSNPCQSDDTCYGDAADSYLCLSSSCRWEEAGITYHGTATQTSGERTCQRWDAQTPNAHTNSDPDEFQLTTHETLSDAANYCRNPTSNVKVGPWCYTSDGVAPTWDYCTVPGCSPDCDSDPCQNGATCVRRWIEGYNCTCDTNYYGIHCTNPCDSSPCQLNGTCNVNLETGLDYTCGCADGTTGTHCEYYIACLSNPCENGATCGVEDANVHNFECTCMTGKNGTQCEHHQMCLSSPCENDGTCIPHPDGGEPYVCVCVAGKTGTHCEYHIPCLSSPCREGHTCHDDNWDTYICLSSDCRWEESGISYYGHLNTTANNYTCQDWSSQSPNSHSLTGSSFYVEVDLEPAQDYCRNPDESQTSPWCYVTDAAVDGPTWDYCTVPGCSLDCESDPCQNGATCVRRYIDGYNCTCADKYYGIHCTNPCDSDPCMNNATCNPNLETGLDYTCTCIEGMTGVHCEYWTICLSEPCMNGGTCGPTDEDVWNYQCECPIGKNGTQCEIHYTCLSNPCLWEGTCIEHEDGGEPYHCLCKPGKTGQHCEYHIPCMSSPCRDGDTCWGDNWDTYICLSSWCRWSESGESYYGPLNMTSNNHTCQRWDVMTPHEHIYNNNSYFMEEYMTDTNNYCRNPSLDPDGPWCYTDVASPATDYCAEIPGCSLDCESAPCQNGGTCIPGWVDGYNCTCPELYYGLHCTNPCDSSPCQNDGTCNPNTETGLDYTCTCAPGKTGVHCEFHIVCLSNPCRDGDTCHGDLWDTYICLSSFCRWDEIGHHYYGTHATTLSGKTCQDWTAKTPHSHSVDTTGYFIELNVTDANNYCRNPDNSSSVGPWCYTTDPDKTWETCDIRGCSLDCDSSPCMNGATCVPGYETGYYCKCVNGDYEEHCEKRAVVTNTTATYSFVESSFTLAGYDSIIFDVTLFPTNEGTCSEIHSSIRLADDSDTEGYIADIGQDNNNKCKIHFYMSGYNKKEEASTSCTTPLKCNEARKFWMRWTPDSWTFEFGSGPEVGLNVLSTFYNDRHPISINKLAFSGYSHSENRWWLLGACKPHCLNCYFDGDLTSICTKCDFLYNLTTDNNCAAMYPEGYFYIRDTNDPTKCWNTPINEESDNYALIKMTNQRCGVYTIVKAQDGLGTTTMSVQSAEFPNHVIRHTGYYIYLEKRSAFRGSLNDAVFIMTNDTVRSWRFACAIESLQSYFIRPDGNDDLKLMTDSGSDQGWIYPVEIPYKLGRVGVEYDTWFTIEPDIVGLVFALKRGPGASTENLVLAPDESATNVYRIIVHKDKALLRLSTANNDDTKTKSQSNLLTTDKYDIFWVSWRDGYIKFGRGPVAYGNEMYSYRHASPYNIKIARMGKAQHVHGFLLGKCSKRCGGCTLDNTPSLGHTPSCYACEDGFVNRVDRALGCFEYRYVGCFADGSNNGGDMSTEGASDATMTIQKCAYKCINANYTYAGLQYGSFCGCGNYIGTHGSYIASKCQTNCAGDSTKKCGGAYANSIFVLNPQRHSYMTDNSKTNVETNLVLDTNITAVIFDFMGCRSAFVRLRDPTNNEALTYEVEIGKDSNVQNIRHGSNFPVQKTETSTEISCSTAKRFWVRWKDGNIRMGRDGEALESQLIEWTDSSPMTPDKLGIATSEYIGYWDILGLCPEHCATCYFDSTNTTTCSLCEPNYFIFNNTCLEYRHLGCYADASSRDLRNTISFHHTITPEKCAAMCYHEGYHWSGIQVGDSCFCDNRYNTYGKKGDAECDHYCNGESSTRCGGSWRNNIWELYPSYKCYSSPCQNMATCINDYVWENYTCSCTYEWVGIHCEHPNPCLSSPCLNGATCQPQIDGTYICDCVWGIIGTHCEFNDPCISFPCLNGGSCNDNWDDGTFMCSCFPQQLGYLCEIETMKATWSKIKSTGNNIWSNCADKGCEGAPNVTYCQNLARHEDEYGANLVLYNPTTNHCCKKYCANPWDRALVGASGSNVGHEIWVMMDDRDNWDYKLISSSQHSNCECPGNTISSLDHCKYHTMNSRSNVFNWRSSDSYCQYRRCYNSENSPVNAGEWRFYRLDNTDVDYFYIPFNRTTNDQTYIIGYPFNCWRYHGHAGVSNDGVRHHVYLNGDQSISCGWLRHSCMGNVHLCASGWTLSVWLKFVSDASHSNWQMYMDSGGTHSNWGFNLFGGSSNLYTSWITSTQFWGHIHTPMPSYNVWHHISVTWGPFWGLKLYVDGVMKAHDMTPAAAPSFPNGGADLYIGQFNWRTDGADMPAFGIDELLITGEEYNKYQVWQIFSTTHHSSACETNLCENGATCSQNTTSLTSFCDCAVNYIGQFCEYLDPCTSSPCQNGATCEPDPDTGFYNCSCTWDHIGTLCQFLNPCVSEPCQNGATCVYDDTTGHFECVCTWDRVGIQCEHDQPCLSSPCQNYGSCMIHYNEGTFHCNCVQDSLGRLCEYDGETDSWSYVSSDHHVSSCSHTHNFITDDIEWCKNFTREKRGDHLNYNTADGTCQVRVCNDGDARLHSGYSGWRVWRRNIFHAASDFERINTRGQGGHCNCAAVGEWTLSLLACKYYTLTHHGNAFNWRDNTCYTKRCTVVPYSVYFNGDGWDVYTLKVGSNMMYVPLNRTYSNRVVTYGKYPDGYFYNGASVGYYHKRFSMWFEGSDDYLNFGYSMQTCMNRLELCPYGVTWSFWMRSAGSSGRDDFILTTGANHANGAGLAVRLYSTTLYIYLSKNSYRYVCSQSFAYNKWKHVSITWTNDLGLTVYVNGKKTCVDTSTSHYGQSYDYTYLTLGRSIDNYHYGRTYLSDLMFFDRWKTRWDVWDMFSSTSHYNVCSTNPCENGGSCMENPINLLDYCECPVGWVGLFCEVPDPCISDPCQHGATCNHDLEVEFFNCTCTWDYIGDLCQYLDPCLSNPCMAGGTCTRYPSDGHFFCGCTENNLGLQCEVNVNVPMDLTISMDVSHTVSDDAIVKQRQFITHLMTRFTVSQSHTRVSTHLLRDSCGANSRLNSWGDRNGPTNAINGYGRYGESRDIWCSLRVTKDDIYHPSYGDRPGNRDVYLIVTTGNSEVEAERVAAEAERVRQAGILITVVAIGSNSLRNEMSTIVTPPVDTHLFITDSPTTLVGNEFLPEQVLAALFEMPEDPCLSSPCMNGASCLRGNWTLARAESYTCLCSNDYFGTHCEWLKPCLSSPCMSEGTCEQEPVGGTFYCHCTYNYNITLFERIGVQCEFDNPCLSYPCQMNGTCVDQRDTGFFVCDCTWDRIGVVCEYDNPCLSSPCLTNGTCLEEPYNGTYTCDCTYDRVGLWCEFDNPCLSDPCQHDASCLPQTDGSYVCMCTWDYIGTHCEHYDPCISQPCQHGSTCWHHPDDGTYSCNCTWDYIGTHCEYFDPCLSDPCHYQGTCHNEAYNGTYICECSYDRVGVWCEFPNPCLSDPCEVDGTCLPHDEDGTFHCACRSDRVGLFCEFDERDPCQAFPCMNGGSCASKDPYKYFSCNCPNYATSEYCESFMCQDTTILNFTKITQQNINNFFYIYRDMPVTCKGDVIGVMFNAIRAGSFYLDIWEMLTPTVYNLKRKVKITSPGPGRQSVFLDSAAYIPTEENYYWGTHYASINSPKVFYGFDSRDTSGALTGTPWNSKTMTRILYAKKFNNDIKIGRNQFRQGNLVSYRKIPAMQPLVMMDVKGCVKVKLPDTYKSEESAWTVGLRDDVELEASIMKKCPIGNLSIEWSWYRKSLTNGDYFYARIDPKYYTSGGAVMRMPAREYSTGLWRIKASIDTIPTSDQIFARVVPAELVGIITGGTSLTVSKGKMFTIDAKTKSDDPDADGDPGLNWSWSCHEGEVMVQDFKLVTQGYNITKCVPRLEFIYDVTDGILRVDTTNIPPGLYTFRVKVYKDVRMAFYDQMLNLVDGFVPEMKVGCLMNCAARVVPTTKLSLVLKCPQCAELDEFVYKWTMFSRQGIEYIAEDLEAVSASGTNGEGLVVRPNSFTPGKFYRLRLTMNCATCAESFTDYSFMTNLPPEPGSCYIDPQTGESLITEFAGICEGWISGGSSSPDIDQVPLSYKFFTLNDDKSLSLIYFGTSAAMPPMPIGLGPADNNYNRTIVIMVLDIYGSATEFKTWVQVKQPDLTAGGGDANEVMSGALGMITDNPKQAAQVISTIGSVLNSDSGGEGGLSAEEATEIRKSMINTISTMAESVEKPDDVIQMTQALGSSTANPNEVDDESINAATGTLLTMTGSASTMLGSAPEAAENVADSIMGTAMNVVGASAAPPASVNVNLEVDEDAQMSPEEIAAAAKKEEEEGAALRAEAATKSKGTTETLAVVGSMVGDSVLTTKAPGEDMSSLSSSGGAMQLQKQKADALGGTECGDSKSAISMPGNLQIGSSSRRKKRNVNSNTNVNLKVNTFNSNPYSWGANTAGMGGVVNMTFQDENGDVLSAEDDLGFGFANPDPAAPLDVNMTTAADPTSGIVYHKVAVGMANSSIVLQLMPPEGALLFDLYVRAGEKPTPTDYDYYALILGNETEDASTNGVFTVVPGSYLGTTGLYYIGLRPYDPDRVDASSTEDGEGGEGEEGGDGSSSSSRRRRSAPTASAGNSTGNATGYTVAITTTACRAWDNDIQDWVISGEVDQAGTSMSTTKCKGKPEAKRSSFGCGFISPPNSIDFSSVFSKFADLGENPAVFSLVISIILAYFLGLPFIIRLDRKDKIKWKFDELDDNDPDDTYFYKVTVETGLKRGAGTMSNPGFMLYGRYAETGKRSMVPKTRQGFETGSTRLLIMRTYECLGKLEFLRIWHDNTGKDSKAGWFIDTITFEDMKKGIKGIFICQKDLSVTSDYGKTFAAFKAAVREERGKFSYLLKRTTKMKFTDGHMWASVALIPFRSPFTRTQRLSVCICALFLSMVTSMMFYKTDDNVENPYQITLGPIKFTLQQLWVGFVSAIVAVPPTMFIVQVYRGVNKDDANRDEVELRVMMGASYDQIIKKQKTDWLNFGFGMYDDVSVSDMSLLDSSEEESSNSRSILSEDLDNDANSVFSDWSDIVPEATTAPPPQQKESSESEEEEDEIDLAALDNLGLDGIGEPTPKKMKEKEYDSDGNTIVNSSDDDDEDEDEEDDEEDEEEEELDSDEEEVVEEETPEERAARENKRKKLVWCFLIAAWFINISGILVPGFFVILYSMEWGKEKAEEWLIAYMMSWAQALFVTDPIKVIVIGLIATIIAWRHIMKAQEKGYKHDKKEMDFQLPSDDLLNAEKLAEEKKKLEARAKARGALKEMGWHLILVLLSVSLSFGGTGQDGHQLYDGIHDMFINKFEHKVISYKTYFHWLEKYFIPNFYVEQDINNKSLNWRERKFLVDRSSYRVGVARFRQLRMPEVDCPLHSVVRTCVMKYDRSEHEKLPYGPLRYANISDPYSYDNKSYWVYQTSGMTNGFLYMGLRNTYGAGGYVVPLGNSKSSSLDVIANIKKDLWIDRQTRAVILEFTVYNPNIDLFAFVSIVAEFSETAGIQHHFQIQVMRAFSMGALSMYIYLCKAILIIYMLVNLGFAIHSIVKVEKKAFFKNAKNIIDMVILALVLAGGVLFIMRLITLNEVLEKCREDNYKTFAEFARAAAADEVYKYCIAILNALVIMKLIMILKLVKRIGALQRTLQHSGPALISFAMCFVLFVFAFGLAQHIVYMSHMADFSTIIGTMENAFATAMGSFDADGMMAANSLFTFVTFPLYMILMNWIMFSILVTIIMDSHYEFKNLAVPDDERVLGEMLTAFWGQMNAASKLSTVANPV